MEARGGGSAGSSVLVSFYRETDEADIEKRFGLKRDDILGLAGVQEDTKVEIRFMKVEPNKEHPRDAVKVVTDGKGWYSDREIYEKHIENHGFKIDDPSQRGKGFGLKVFSEQVDAAVARGYKRIETMATRGGGSMNGYYTWGRFGYDGRVRLEAESKALTAGFKPERLDGKLMVSDLMKTQAGRSWWKENGISTEMEFDLSAGSQSRRVFDAYRKAKSESGGTPGPVTNGRRNSGYDLGQSRQVENSRWEFKTTQQQLDEFMNWLASQLSAELLAIQFNDIEKTYWGEYIRQAYEKGVGRVFDELRGQPILTEGSVRSFYNGTKEEFLRSTFAQPVSIDRVKALASRTFTELKNVSSAMGTEMSRVLVDGLAQGKSPYDVGRDLNRAIDGIGKKRATMIAQTEIIRAHAEGQLDSMERHGVQEVGVMVEWSTSKKSNVCRRCAALGGIVLTTHEARGLIPVHPRCHCSFLPANVGEDRKKTKAKSKFDQKPR